ncbi:MAG: hypothetical protein KC731_19430 [Myxococcales bacterium]|nr:hypothetical protein [Myxococcales bacterium]
MGGGFNPIDCLTCIGNNCPTALQCITDPTCAQGVLCSVQSCFMNGQPDFICVLGCFNGDINAALLALQAVQCVFGTCGMECGGSFPGLP